MGTCCSTSRKRSPRGDEREPLLPKYASDVPSQSQFDKVAEILVALKAGKYPSQEQIDRALRIFLNSDVLKTGNSALSGPLSAHGRQLIDDVRHILEALVAFGMEKNGDDKIQGLLWHLSRMEQVPVKTKMDILPSLSVELNGGVPELPKDVVSQEEFFDDMRKAASSIRSFMTLLITSNAFRIIISDILVTARDILADLAIDVAKVAAIIEVRAGQVENAIRPTDTELVDEKHREGGVGAPSFEQLAHASQSAQETAAGVTHSTLEEVESRRRNLWQKMREDDPDRVKETVLKRIEEIIAQAQASPKYTAALVTMASLLQKYIQKLALTMDTLGNEAISSIPNVDASFGVDPQIEVDPHLSGAFEDMKTIIERLSGHGLDLLTDRLLTLIRQVGIEEKESDGLLAVIDAAAAWFNRSLLHPDWMQTIQAQEEGSRLYDWATDIFQKKPKLKANARSVLEETYAIYDALASDQTTNVVISAIQALGSDLEIMGKVGLQLATLESAKRWEAVKGELWKDAVNWVLPRILRALRTVPLPRIELKSDALDLVIDKVTLASPSFVPDHLRIINHTELELRASDAIEEGFMESSSSTRTRINIDGLRISIEDIAYYLNAKGPLCLGWMDNGLITVDVGEKRVEGEGISILLDLEIPSSEVRQATDKVFRVLDAKVDVPGLTFSLDQTRHWIFNALVTQPLLGPLVRTGLSMALSSQIKSSLEAFSNTLSSLHQKAKALHSGDASSVTLEDYWGAFTYPDSPTTSPSHETSSASLSPSPDVHTQVETEVTTKGVVRRTRVENLEGEIQSETVLAIGVGEQILPGLGGPEIEDPPTLAEQGREALGDLEELRQKAKGKAAATIEEADGIRETVKERIALAGKRTGRTKARDVKSPDWRSPAFDLQIS
ncbi:hypothetical protein FRC14_003648 [Serendipita sp. 396]|nr:hypothetical protein FRC14_003648 [Serendipita sp. 396]KAG8788158.1 hypothetical protein FRC15_005859 [Serendipita sp. 397]KAG8803357.1 hypothetical protein FRC16_005799 [Serendipita sp. 398]KAG8874421.1 hypothetical protein FRC20_005901 [Serendipita sp. 405]